MGRLCFSDFPGPEVYSPTKEAPKIGVLNANFSRGPSWYFLRPQDHRAGGRPSLSSLLFKMFLSFIMRDLIEGVEGRLKEIHHEPPIPRPPQRSISSPVPFPHSSLGVLSTQFEWLQLNKQTRNCWQSRVLAKRKSSWNSQSLWLEGMQTWFSHFGERQPHS